MAERSLRLADLDRSRVVLVGTADHRYGLPDIVRAKNVRFPSGCAPVPVWPPLD
ncbi:hypothetical protein [Kutzneria sp. 744]|uniref:hypothetical protein n=1 Tax=Kutzneria sp. (strain 744) TaxID=345341 RepID=UPI0004BBF9A7|nr:hypothetical protein [Kutzneria sp. 744]